MSENRFARTARSAVTGLNALRCLILLSGLLIGSIAAFAQSGTPTATATLTPTATPTPMPSVCPVTTTPSPAPSSTPTVSVIIFDPPVAVLDNIGMPGNKKHKGSFRFHLTAYDNNGNPMEPSEANPMHVQIDSASPGLFTPTFRKVIDGNRAEFQYSGGNFPSGLNVEAWMKIPQGTSALGRYALGITQILAANPVACTYKSKGVPLAVDCAGETTAACETDNITSPHGLQVMAAVGYAKAEQAVFTPFTVDTGSLGVIVPISQLPTGANANWIGPGAPGTKDYTSNGGTTFTGNYYLAPVDLQKISGGVVATSRIMVLVLGAGQSLNYLGVGFNRENGGSEDLFQTPADNAFLHLSNKSGGNHISAGYRIGAASLGLGITSTTGYNLIPLTTEGAKVPGEYNDAAGCFSFPDAADNQGPFCGNMLFDIGIEDMILDIDDFQRPTEYDTGSSLPTGATVNIVGGSTSSPAMCYGFTLGSGDSLLMPDSVDWAQPPTPCGVFFNTGRRALASYDYMYDATCGNVGFEPLSAPLAPTTDCMNP